MYALYVTHAHDSAITTAAKSQRGVHFPGPGIFQPVHRGLAEEGGQSAANKLEKPTSFKGDKGRAGGARASRSPAPRNTAMPRNPAGEGGQGSPQEWGTAGLSEPYPREPCRGSCPAGCPAFGSFFIPKSERKKNL